MSTISGIMADEVNLDGGEETTGPSWNSSEEVIEESSDVNEEGNSGR